MLSPAHRVAADLDGFLGDPMEEEAGPFSYKEIVEAEERDELPRGAVDAVRAWGFPKYLVPAGLGGRLTTLEDLFFVTRGISRRSVTVAVMYGSGLLAVNPVWLWGNGWQRKTVADGVLNGDLACFGSCSNLPSVAIATIWVGAWLLWGLGAPVRVCCR
ncbi:MAG TPA: acyl-CoA dehydrogenase family protein [Vulgatibacteraceae bacterium]|nr:acyl-CoA dehydrogenase family protein [Vulgatibacteraceae bacterium]